MPASVAAVETRDGDSVVRLRTGGAIPVTPRWAGAGYPRDVERALRDRPADRELVLVAESFSPGAIEMLAEHGVGWLGLDGSMLIELGGAVYIERRPDPVDRPTSGSGGIRWTASAADVAESLLSGLVAAGPEGSHRPVPLVHELAARSGRSLGAVSKALRDFEAEGWVVQSSEDAVRSRGRRPARTVEDPGALLDGWAGFARSSAADRRFHVLDRDPERIAARLAGLFGRDMVFGGLIAADRIAPYSTGISVVRCHIDGEKGARVFDRLAAEAGLTPTTAGARVVVSESRQPVFAAASDRDGLRITGPIRAYVDLLGDSVRGEEPAEHLRRVAIGF